MDNIPENSDIIKNQLKENEPYNIFLLHCYDCGGISYYNMGFYCTCEWCGEQLTGDEDEDEPYFSLEQYWLRKDGLETNL